ncbi:MAG: Eco57I restriction-modification methylase domain-containing protein [Acholeplasma sp.]|nr:Eco57I restriction-modification methylase domain-containing protein [Acholeplasma sp.]
MVNNSMVNYLAEKTSISVKRLSDFLDEVGTSENISHHFTEKEKSSIIYSLSKVKVIDPACGSGAFPIGILQKMVSILQFIDPDNSKWIDTQLKNANDELKKHILESFNKNNLNYIRKLALIKDSIFGIDIQPIATEIAKLRCFLTLIVEEVVDDNEPNRGIKPLPNLDFKFVTANSLIKLNDDYGFGERELIEKLGSIRAQYFTASYEERLELQSQFSNIQVDMSIFISDFWQSAGGNPTLEKLRRWKPFDYESTSWFDSEWMFGVSKFDIIITNPPYLDSEHMTRQMPEMREELSQLYYTASGNWDLFVLFIELSSKLLNKTGTMVFIVPNKLLSQKYADKCREILFKNNYITEIRDYSRVKVFKDADVYPIVMTVSKQKRSETIDAFIMNDVDQSSIKITMDRKDVNKDNLDMLFIEDEIALSILLKMDLNKRLQDYGADIRDASTVSDAYSMKELIFDSRESITPSFKLLNSGTIDPYVSLWGIKKTQYIKDSYMYPRINHSDLKKIRNKYDDAISEKIVIANMTNRLEAYYDIGEYVALKSTILIKDSSVNLLSLSGFINSKLYTFYYRNKHKSTQMSGGALSISKSRVENLPIPNMNKADSDTLNNLVIDYINKKDINIILDIDNLIYRLFDLSPDQIEYMDKINLIG